jgi:hypothetical protein
MATVACNAYLESVSNDECLGSSLPKINSNFTTLQEILWSLRERADSRVEVRTFFYYGPNSAGPTGSKGSGQLSGGGKGSLLPPGLSPAGSGMDDNKTSRPSNLTVEAFINSSSQINLPSISSPGDIAYVIYQKTGFLSTIGQNVLLQSSSQNVGVTYEQVRNAKGRLTGDIRPVSTFGRNINFNQLITTDDIVMLTSPTFVIWKLTCSQRLSYLVDQGFPKFHRAQTSQQTSKLGVNVPQPLSWDQPQNWSLF